MNLLEFVNSRLLDEREMDIVTLSKRYTSALLPLEAAKSVRYSIDPMYLNFNFGGVTFELFIKQLRFIIKNDIIFVVYV